MSGCTFTQCEWYKKAKRGLAVEEPGNNDRNDYCGMDSLRESTLLKLDSELKAIQAAMNSFGGRYYSAHALLLHIYHKHPPKKEDYVFDVNLSRDDCEAVLKALKTAVTHYHPDKTFNKSAGFEWEVLSEEITKYLNQASDRFKPKQDD